MSDINANVIILKSSNIDEINNSAKKIKKSSEKINDVYNVLSGPNKCDLYGDNLNKLKQTEDDNTHKIFLLSSAYKEFEEELSKFETTEAKKINDIKVPQITNLTKGKEPGPSTEPIPEPNPKPQPDPNTEPVTEAPSEPGPYYDVDPITPPSGAGDTNPVSIGSFGDDIRQVTLTTPDVPSPEPETMETIEVSTETEIETTPLENIVPIPQTTPVIEVEEKIPSIETIKDQIEIPLVEKSSKSNKGSSSNDGLILAGGLTAVGALAFGAVQGVSALEKKEEEEKEKNKEPKYIVKDEGDK